MKTLISIAVAIFLLLLSLLFLIPSLATAIAFVTALGLAVYFFVMACRFSGKKYSQWMPPFLVLFLLLPFVFGIACFILNIFSIVLVVLLVSLTLTFFYNFLNVPLAIYHKRMERKLLMPFPLPSVSVIVPAHNEEKVLEKTLEALLGVDYPRKEIVVIDDGSTDRTYEIAKSFEDRGVRVFKRPQGGKSAALNYGLMVSKGEIVVPVDADSLVERGALRELVKRFQNPKVMAVCGNVKVANRVNFLTRCQALEYIVNINVERRALDLFGCVPVVPGALGAFRRGALRGGGFYDPDTITEDFDVTIKTLKARSIVQASSFASVYTEAPESLRGFIKQRLRWRRGTFQTMLKHRDALFNPRFGFLQKLALPYVLLGMIFIPFAGIAVIASVAAAILGGALKEVLLIFAYFNLLQTMLSALAIKLDEEDIRLALYSPFFVVGYKHLIDFLTIKSLFDVLIRRKRWGWTRAERVGRGLRV